MVRLLKSEGRRGGEGKVPTGDPLVSVGVSLLGSFGS